MDQVNPRMKDDLAGIFLGMGSANERRHYYSNEKLDLGKAFQWDSLSQLANASPGLILGLRPANERRSYFVKTSLIGWVQ